MRRSLGANIQRMNFATSAVQKPPTTGIVSDLLLHFEDANGSTTFVDSGSHGFAVSDPTGQSYTATNNKRFGASSLFVNGVGSAGFDTSPFMLLDGDFTIEGWVNTTTNTKDICPILASTGTSNSNVLAFGIGGSNLGNPYAGRVAFWNGSIFPAYYGTSILSGWAHIAVCRSVNQLYLFANGVLEKTATTTASFNFGAGGGTKIGYAGYVGNGTGYNRLAGYLDELRVIKGTALYTSSFTPPSAPFAA